MAQMAALARDEEAWWQAELAWLKAPQVAAAGRPVRGGGRAAGGQASILGLAIEASRLAALAPALQRRLIRYAASGTIRRSARFFCYRSRASTRPHRPGRPEDRTAALLARRKNRTESCGCRSVTAFLQKVKGRRPQAPAYEVAIIPGEIDAPAFELRLRIEIRGKVCDAVGDAVCGSAEASGSPNGHCTPPDKTAILRNWKPGDRVTLRHSSGPRKVKEVLERLRVTGTDRTLWPVLEINGQIVWMRGIELEHDPGLAISAEFCGRQRCRTRRQADLDQTSPGQASPDEVSPEDPGGPSG